MKEKKFTDTIIPKCEIKLNWECVNIKEYGEKFVNLNKVKDSRLIVKSKYFDEKIRGAIKEIYVRETVYSLILKALDFLPSNYQLLVWDGWRPLDVQKYLYKKSLDIRKKRSKSGYSLEEKEAEKYAANPEKRKINKIPPHLTGGAVDVALVKNGKLVNMGTDLDYFGEEANTDYFESEREKSDEIELIKKNRRLLYWVMLEAGFTNYPMEWWHYDYGNQLWGLIKKKDAFYGPIEIITGELVL